MRSAQPLLGLFIAIAAGSFTLACGGDATAPKSAPAAPTIPKAGPAAPTIVRPRGASTQVIIAWASAPSLSYHLYWSTRSGVTPSTGTLIDQVTSPHAHVGLTALTPYYYVVTASNASGVSAPSAEVTATPDWVAAGATSGAVWLNWLPVPDATSYNIYWSTTTGVTPTNGARISGLSGSQYTHWGRINGTPYHYVITPVYGANEGAPSHEMTAMPIVTAGTPSVTATAGNGQVTLDWTGLAGGYSASSYEIYWSTTSGFAGAGHEDQWRGQRLRPHRAHERHHLLLRWRGTFSDYSDWDANRLPAFQRGPRHAGAVRREGDGRGGSRSGKSRVTRVVPSEMVFLLLHSSLVTHS